MAERSETRLTRRAFLRWPLRRHASVERADISPMSEITFDSPVITPIGRFYRQPPRSVLPVVDHRAWTLAVDGLVRRPLTLSYDALRARPAAGDVRTLVSAANPPGGGMIGNAAWRGCRLADLLAEAEVLPDATHVRLEGADGCAVAIPLADPCLPETLLAYEMNGALLPREYGGPLRALIPGLYDEASVQWLTRISLLPLAEPSCDEVQPVRTCACILTPRPYAAVPVGLPVALQGVAFAGLRGIAAVAVSVDGGDWMPAILRAPDSPYAWTQWYTLWTPEMPGEYRIAARVTDGAGNTQRHLAGPGMVPGRDEAESALTDTIHWIVVRAVDGVNGG